MTLESFEVLSIALHCVPGVSWPWLTVCSVLYIAYQQCSVQLYSTVLIGGSKPIASGLRLRRGVTSSTRHPAVWYRWGWWWGQDGDENGDEDDDEDAGRFRGESARGWEISHRLYTQTLESNCIRTGWHWYILMRKASYHFARLFLQNETSWRQSKHISESPL